MILSRRGLMVGGMAALALAGCNNTFHTFYEKPVDAKVSRGWHVVDVRVAVPQSLTVSEAKTWEPTADIVWREDPDTGDRHAQVAAIMKTAVALGAKGLHGPRQVRLELTVSRFHALTFEAEKALENVGVHNINFVIQAVDARTGAVLAGPEAVDAAFPAMSGQQMYQARQRGETQKSQIIAHVRDVTSGWLGIGPDPRMTFVRAGE